MSAELIVGIGGALLSGSLLPSVSGFVWRRLRRDPKAQADTRKTNAEAGHIEWQTLRDEINRLQVRVEAQDDRIAELEKLDGERADREAGLKNENRLLRTNVRKLEKRIADLEEIFNITRPTPEQRALLNKLKDVD